jgi:DNA primase
MDVVALAQLGFPNAVATLGTACTTEHLQKLFRFTDSVIFSFDGDHAGRRAARKALDGAIPFASDVRSVKFLFLPSEHDPDSFIREFGKDAFARFVSEAVPLSRFLIDAAREGCELGTAEGRARMASRAQPLWTALPDGALKRQLLVEIADEVQLASRELVDLWTSSSGASPNVGSRRYQGGRPLTSGDHPDQSKSESRRPRITGRAPPISRADHATRLLLGHMTALDLLSAEDHSMLCELPEPHGTLFVWLEGQLHEHGAQPWVALREGLRGHEQEQMAVRLMKDYELGPDDEADATLDELRHLLNRMLVERLKVQETQAIQEAKANPGALSRYRELQARRLQLEASLSAARGDQTGL